MGVEQRPITRRLHTLPDQPHQPLERGPPPWLRREVAQLIRVRGEVVQLVDCTRRACTSVKVTGLAQSFKLAQYFDCKFLLTASSWPNFWAHPVTFTLQRRATESARAETDRSG